MSYARKLLARGEEVVLESRQHWFVVVGRSWWAIILAILGLALVIFGVGRPAGDGLASPAEILGLGLLIIGIARIGWVIWDWRNNEFLVTTRRIVRAEGILNKRMVETSLEKVNDAVLTQSMFGRLFGFGDLDILTAADEMGGIEDFPMVADPVEFKVAMMNQKEVVERPDIAPQAYQRQTAPDLVPAEPMAPRAGSDQVTVLDEPAPAPPAEAPAAAAHEAAAGDAAAATGAPPPTSTEDPTATLERLASLRDRGLITAEEYDAKKRELLERI